MIKVTRELAERMANIAELLVSEDSADAPVRQLAELSLELIPGSAAAGVVAAGDAAWTHAASTRAGDAGVPAAPLPKWLANCSQPGKR